MKCDVLAVYGDCNNGSPCTDTGETCNNDDKCVCDSGYVNSAGTCVSDG